MDAVKMIGDQRFLRAAAGLAACLVLFGEGSSISSRAGIETFAVMTGTNPLSGGITIMAAFFAVAVFSQAAGRLLATKSFLVGDGVANAAGAVLVLSGTIGIPGSEVLAPAGGLAIGFSSTLLLVRWADVLVPRGARESSLCLACAMLMVVAYDVLAKALVDIAFAVSVVLLCALSPWLLALAASEGRGEEEARAIAEYRGVVPVWLSFATVALYAVAMGGVQVGGAGQNTLFEGIAELLASAGIAIDAGIVIAAVAILLGARFLHGNNMSFFRLTILALLSVALYLSAALAANWGVVNLVIMTVARMLIFAYVWALFSTPARTMSPMRLFSVGWLLFLVPNMLITRLGLVVSGGQGSSAAFELALAVALLLLFVFEFTPLLTDRYANEDGAESPGAAAEPKDAFAARIAALVDHGRLTPREQDVLVALARGRSAQYIADTFVVSKETARTHIRHIYQKLAVHSREELMDLVEEGMPRPDQRTAVNSPVSESIT